MYDVIVVGARCGGAATALQLARSGLRVLMVDRVAFPSDTVSTHFIHVSGVAALHRWGVLPAVHASGAPPIERMGLDFGPFTLAGRPPADGDIREMVCCRRTVLDKLLCDAAVAAGVELRERFTVEELVRDDTGAVCGIRGGDGRDQVVEHARLVVGADGRHSMVAREVGAAEYEAAPALTCAYYSYWSGVECNEAALYPRPGRAIAVMPTNDGLTCVYVAAPVAEFHAFRDDVEGSFMRSLRMAGDVAERVGAGRREERFRGTADLPNFLRVPAGPGWALVGDAGCHKDPVPAQGISDAFRDAELLAAAAVEGLSSGTLSSALAGYATARDEAELPRYRFALQLASLEPPAPEFAQMLQSLAGDRAGTERFLGLLAGTTRFDDFFREPLPAGAA